MIVINIYLDITPRSCVSYDKGKEELEKGKGFDTNCLDFFSFDTKADDVIVWRACKSVSRNNLTRSNDHTDKEIREAHDIRKMLVAGKFKFT